jgi:hypothetical protein
MSVQSELFMMPPQSCGRALSRSVVRPQKRGHRTAWVMPMRRLATTGPLQRMGCRHPPSCRARRRETHWSWPSRPSLASGCRHGAAPPWPGPREPRSQPEAWEVPAAAAPTVDRPGAALEAPSPPHSPRRVGGVTAAAANGARAAATGATGAARSAGACSAPVRYSSTRVGPRERRRGGGRRTPAPAGACKPASSPRGAAAGLSSPRRARRRRRATPRRRPKRPARGARAAPSCCCCCCCRSRCSAGTTASG